MQSPSDQLLKFTYAIVAQMSLLDTPHVMELISDIDKVALNLGLDRS